MKVIISADGDSVGNLIGRMELADDAEGVARLSVKLDKGNEIIKNWAILHGGRVISIGGDQCCVEVDMDYISELPAIVQQYEELTGATLSVGCGIRLSEATKSLIYAKTNGKNQIVFYSPEVEQAIIKLNQEPEESEQHKISNAFLAKADVGQRDNPSEEEYKHKGPEEHLKGKASKGYKSHVGTHRRGAFGEAAVAAPSTSAQPIKENPNMAIAQMYDSLMAKKAMSRPFKYESRFHEAAQAHHQKEQQAKQNKKEIDAQLKAQIVSILQKVKAQSPMLEKIRQNAPDLYQSIIQMTQAMILLGREVVGESVQKEPLAKAEYWRSRLPVGSQIDTSADGTRSGGKIKIRTADGKERWISIRSGKIMGIDGGPRSSLRPETNFDVQPVK